MCSACRPAGLADKTAPLVDRLSVSCPFACVVGYEGASPAALELHAFIFFSPPVANAPWSWLLQPLLLVKKTKNQKPKTYPRQTTTT